MAKVGVDFVFIENFDKEKYKEYAELNESKRKSLPSTNFWLIKTGKEPIPVPPEDKYYEHYFRNPDDVEYV